MVSSARPNFEWLRPPAIPDSSWPSWISQGLSLAEMRHIGATGLAAPSFATARIHGRLALLCWASRASRDEMVEAGLRSRVAVSCELDVALMLLERYWCRDAS